MSPEMCSLTLARLGQVFAAMANRTIRGDSPWCCGRAGKSRLLLNVFLFNINSFSFLFCNSLFNNAFKPSYFLLRMIPDVTLRFLGVEFDRYVRLSCTCSRDQCGSTCGRALQLPYSASTLRGNMRYIREGNRFTLNSQSTQLRPAYTSVYTHTGTSSTFA